MALDIYYDKDADLGRLDGRDRGRDRLRQPGPCPCAEPEGISGVDVVVGLRKESRFLGQGGRARACGSRRTAEDGADEADVVMMTLPDETDGRHLPRGHRAGPASPATTWRWPTASTSTSRPRCGRPSR